MASARRDVFQAIADPTRRDILALIASRPRNLNSIAENFNVSRPAISQHIKVLTECGLVSIRQDGRERHCEPQLDKLEEVAQFIEPLREIWEKRFAALDSLIERLESKEKPTSKSKSKPKNQNKKK